MDRDIAALQERKCQLQIKYPGLRRVKGVIIEDANDPVKWYKEGARGAAQAQARDEYYDQLERRRQEMWDERQHGLDLFKESWDEKDIRAIQHMLQSGNFEVTKAGGHGYKVKATNLVGERMQADFEAGLRRREEIARMGWLDRFGTVWARMWSGKGTSYTDALGEQLTAFSDPWNLAAMGGLAGLGVAAQFTPVGWAFDVGVISLIVFADAEDAERSVLGTLTAETDEEFDEAARSGSRGLSSVTVQVAFYLAGKGIGKGLKWAWGGAAEESGAVSARKPPAGEPGATPEAKPDAAGTKAVESGKPTDAPPEPENKPKGPGETPAPTTETTPKPGRLLPSGSQRPALGDRIGGRTDGTVYRSADNPDHVVKVFDKGIFRQARNEFNNLALARSIHPDNVVRADPPADVETLRSDPKARWLVKEYVHPDTPTQTQQDQLQGIFDDFVRGGVDDLGRDNFRFGHTASDLTPRWILLE